MTDERPQASGRRTEPGVALEPGFQRLDPRVVVVNRVVTGIVSAVLATGSGVIALSIWGGNDWPWWALAPFGGVWLLVNGALAWHGQRWQAIDYRHQSYRVDDRGLEIRRGVVWRVVINVPRSRVQHTDVSQGPLERRFGLGTLVVYTAGSDHAKVTLEGLEHSMALGIREQLMPERGTDAV
jgi:membrane protein YdbS with pleckstrin-like domain